MYKLIAIDLDDTLLNDNLEISPRNRQALSSAVKRGVVVTVATGRMFRSALPFALDLGIEVPIITYQGAIVKNARSGEVLVNRPVPLELARQVLEEGYRAGVHMNVYFNDALYVDSITAEAEGYAKLAGVEMIAVGNLIEFLQEEPTKILYIADPSRLDRLKGPMQDRFGENLYITKSKPNYLEFLHPRATKKYALEELAARFGVVQAEIMAFGDSYNDLEMIEYAGLGVAMGNAPDDIKAKADYVTVTNNEDGVAVVIEKFVLKTNS